MRDRGFRFVISMVHDLRLDATIQSTTTTTSHIYLIYPLSSCPTQLHSHISAAASISQYTSARTHVVSTDSDPSTVEEAQMVGLVDEHPSSCYLHNDVPETAINTDSLIKTWRKVYIPTNESTDRESSP